MLLFTVVKICMFSKHTDNVNQRNADIACWATFVFWSALLLINSTYEIFLGKPSVSNSFTILVSGLIVFFVVDFSLTVFEKSQNHK